MNEEAKLYIMCHLEEQIGEMFGHIGIYETQLRNSTDKINEYRRKMGVFQKALEDVKKIEVTE